MKSLAERVCLRLRIINMNKTELAWQFDKEGMRCSRSMLSQYLNGKYPSRPVKLEERLERWLEETEEQEAAFRQEKPQVADKYAQQIARQFATQKEPEEAGEQEPLLEEEAPPRMGSKPDVFESDDYINIVGICNLCQQQQGSAIVVGRSGYGKTYSLKQYARLPRVIYIECNESMSCRDLVRRIEKQLCLPKRYGTNDERLEEICEFFNVNRGYLMIVDEADKLINKYTIKKIELLRTIMDSAAVGMVLAGELSLEAHLAAYDERFANRMDFAYRLHGLGKAEVERYLEDWSVEERAMEVLTSRARNSKNGCFRLFDRTMNNVIRLMREREQTTITETIINEASAMMLL